MKITQPISIPAQDCNQRRPGATYNVKKKADPEMLDTEYQAFLADMGLKGETSSDTEKPYVPPMGDLSRSFQNSKPLMLTNGSSAPGAASAHARALSDPQRAGGLRTVGTSIFGGKLTTMTSGYKTQAQLEYEREKKRQENSVRPVPTEWKIEQMEKNMNANQDDFMKNLERVRTQEKLKNQLSLPPPPPPPAPPCSKKFKPLYSQFVKSAEDDNLPNLNCNPWEQFKK